MVYDIIHMIASPRNISTAVMYSFARREKTKVLDEPFYAYYLEKTGVPHPGFDEILAALPTDSDEVISSIHEKAEKSNLFIKNMSHHIEGLKLDFLLDHKILLLIRDPKLQIASFSKVMDQPEIRDIGIKAQGEIFEFLRAHDQIPVIIDAGQLLEDPEQIMIEACDRLGIFFTKKMMTWPAGPIEEDGVWAKYWYLNVHQSTGFNKPKVKNVTLTGQLQDLYVEAKPFYDHLYKYAIKVK